MVERDAAIVEDFDDSELSVLMERFSCSDLVIDRGAMLIRGVLQNRIPDKTRDRSATTRQSSGASSARHRISGRFHALRFQ
jgi:hypothetical protein